MLILHQTQDVPELCHLGYFSRQGARPLDSRMDITPEEEGQQEEEEKANSEAAVQRKEFQGRGQGVGLSAEEWTSFKGYNNEASKRITDAKLAKDFQVVLKEFQKAERLAAQRDIAYAPYVTQAVLPSWCQAILHVHVLEGIVVQDVNTTTRIDQHALDEDTANHNPNDKGIIVLLDESQRELLERGYRIGFEALKPSEGPVGQGRGEQRASTLIAGSLLKAKLETKSADKSLKLRIDPFGRM
ncbi:hypothetical protein GIB67_017340 [Kingdonia uniflora]|uniref:Syntaxin N-terminal domain-containing protein n=1 Tax=Kingdonia uniflora TaxID=39325 RepID=A0A7J7N5Y3_9MAGN|nr:hypothetical protein GIB67_017340 [Kingdonia uniflora]